MFLAYGTRIRVPKVGGILEAVNFETNFCPRIPQSSDHIMTYISAYLTHNAQSEDWILSFDFCPPISSPSKHHLSTLAEFQKKMEINFSHFSDKHRSRSVQVQVPDLRYNRTIPMDSVSKACPSIVCLPCPILLLLHLQRGSLKAMSQNHPLRTS